MKYFTITILCHITGRESDYLVSFRSEEALGQYFAGKKDRLIAVSDGWSEFAEWFQVHRERRQYLRKNKPWKVPEDYDYRTDMKGHEY